MYRKGMDNSNVQFSMFSAKAWTTKNMECTVFLYSYKGHGQQKIWNVQFFMFLERARTTKNMESTFIFSSKGHGQQKIWNVQFFHVLSKGMDNKKYAMYNFSHPKMQGLRGCEHCVRKS